MEEYRPVMLNCSYLVALYAIAYISAPLTPNGYLEYGMLALASCWMFYGSLMLQKVKRRPSSLFYGAIALIPWAFYGELWYINNNREGIDEAVFQSNLEHAIFVYQSFKYVVLGCAVLATFKGLYEAVRSFGSTT